MYVNVYVYIYMYVCIYVYICIHTLTQICASILRKRHVSIERAHTKHTRLKIPANICVCVCIYIFKYTYIYIYIYIHVWIYAESGICLNRTCTHKTHTSQYTCVYLCIRVYLYMYIHFYIHMYIYVYIHIYTWFYIYKEGDMPQSIVHKQTKKKHILHSAPITTIWHTMILCCIVCIK